MRALLLVSILIGLSPFVLVAPASADWPAVVARDDGTEVHGLPAISGDGHTLAVLREDTSRSGSERVAVELIDVRTGATSEWLVVARDDEGHPLPLPADERGDTAWRRARNLTLHFAARGFRPLATLDASDVETGVVLEGAGLTLSQPTADDEVVVTDAQGRERLRARLPLMTSFCGMSEDAPSQQPPTVLEAQVDLRTRTLLLSYGHVYASCMCDDDVTTDVLRLHR